MLSTGKPSNNRGEDPHKWLEDAVVGNTPPLPPRLQVLDQLVYGPNEHVRALKDVDRTQLRPAPGEVLRRLATIVRDDDSLDKRVQLEPFVSVAGSLSHELQPLVDASRPPAGHVLLDPAASKRDTGQADDVGFPRREGQKLPAVVHR